MLYIFNASEVLIAVIPLKDVLSAKHKEVLNGENTFTFTYLADKPEAEFIADNNLVAFKDLDSYWQIFEIKRIVDFHGDGLTRTAYCEHIFYELLDDVVTDKRPSADAAAALAGMLENTRWQVGIVDDLGVASTSAYYISALKADQKVAEAWGGELRWRCVINGGVITRYVDLLKMRGVDTGKQFVYGKDIHSIEREEDISGIATALYGRGKGVETESGDSYGRRLTFADVEWKKALGDPVDKPLGQEWVGHPEALLQSGRNGRHKFDVFTDEEETDAVKLLENTWNFLDKVKRHPKVTYRLKAQTLEKLSGYKHEAVRLGDLTRVIDKKFKPELLVSARVIELERDLLNDDETNIVLGNFAPTIVEATFNIERKIQDVANKTYNTKWLDGVIDVLQNAIQNTQAYVFETPQGTLHLDAPTYEQATSAMLLGGGRFAIANQKDGNGGWNWRTFGDGSGFTADLITAGIIDAGLVQIGPQTTFAPGYDPSQISSVGMGVDADCTALFHFDGSLNSHKGLTPTFTRDSVAYLSDGTQVPAGQPRFEGGKFGKGVLIEEGTTNLVVNGNFQSEFASWIKEGTPASGEISEIIKDGNKNFYYLYKNTGGNLLRISQGITLLANTTYTLSAYGKGIGNILIWDGSQIGSLDINNQDYSKSTITFTTGTNTSIGVYLAINGGGTGVGECWFSDVQIEEKPYPTSFVNGTRVGEAFGIPTEGILDANEGVFSFWFKAPAYEVLSSYGYEDIVDVRLDNAPNRFLIFRKVPGGYYEMYIRSGAQYVSCGNIVLSPNAWANLTWTWKNGDKYSMSVDGNIVQSDVYTTGSLAFNRILVVGWGGGSIIDELRIDKVARTDEEIASWYKAQAPFYSSEDMKQWPGYVKVETDGLKVYDPLNELRVLLGSWIENAVREYGLEVIKGRIYSSIVRSGAKEDKTYIQFTPPNYLEVWSDVSGTSKLQLRLTARSGGGGGGIDFYVDDTWMGQVVQQSNGLYISALRDQKLHLYGQDGVDCTGDFRMTSGTKYNIEQTENYGQIGLAVRESPEQRYIDEGMGTLVYGECRVDVDPIFMECIEPHTPDSRWYVTLTPYADVDLYVSEIGDGYFVVKERKGGTSTGAEFTWSLSATRKDYAMIRFMEVLD